MLSSTGRRTVLRFGRQPPQLVSCRRPTTPPAPFTGTTTTTTTTRTIRRHKSTIDKRAFQALGRNSVAQDNNTPTREEKKTKKDAGRGTIKPTNPDSADVVEKSVASPPPQDIPEPPKTTTTMPPEFSVPAYNTATHGELHEFAPKIVVVGVGGAGGNALNNMIAKDALSGVDFCALNTDAQHLSQIMTDQKLQLGVELTRGLGCGANPDAGRMAAEECRAEIEEMLGGAHMVFITAGMGGGTGTGAAPVVAEICYQMGILTVGVVTMPFAFEGTHRRRLAMEGIGRLQDVVDTMIVIPNQNLFSMATQDTSFVDAFKMADDVLLGGVKSITDLMTSPGLINLDFADVQSVMHGMGNALLGTGLSSSSSSNNDNNAEQQGDRAIEAAQQALDNPLLGKDMDISTAKGMLVNITGGNDMTLFEVDRAAQYVTEKVSDASANIIFGSAYDPTLEGSIRVSVVATGIETHENSGAL